MTDAAIPVASPPSAGIMDDVIEIFVAPSHVFERRRNSGYGKHLMVLVVLALVIGLATMSLTEVFWNAQFELQVMQAAEKGTPMQPEAMEVARNFNKWGAILGSALFLPVFIWIGALFVMLGAKVAGASLSYRQSAMVVTLASFPRLLAPIIMAVLGLTMSPESVRGVSDGALGLARFVDPITTSPVIVGILGNIEITNIWALALMGIGISVIGRVERRNGFMGAAVVFACTLALTLIPAALF